MRRFSSTAVILVTVSVLFAAVAIANQVVVTIPEGPHGYDSLSNGFADQATHDADRVIFEQRETVTSGLGLFTTPSLAPSAIRARRPEGRARFRSSVRGMGIRPPEPSSNHRADH